MGCRDGEPAIRTEFFHLPLVGGIGIGEKERHGNGFSAAVCYDVNEAFDLLEVYLFFHETGIEKPPSDAEAEFLGNEGRRFDVPELIELLPRLPPDLDDVLKTPVGYQRRFHSLSLQHSVGSHGGSVNDLLHRSPRKFPEASDYSFGGVIGRGKGLVDSHLPALDVDEIGKGAPRVNPYDQHVFLRHIALL